MIGDGGQDRDIVLAQGEDLLAQIRSRPDRLRIDRPGAQHPAAGNPGHLERPSLKIGDKVFNQEVDRSALPHHAAEVLARYRRGAGEEHRLNPANPFAPPKLGREVLQLAVQLGFRVVLGHHHTP